MNSTAQLLDVRNGLLLRAQDIDNALAFIQLRARNCTRQALVGLTVAGVSGLMVIVGLPRSLLVYLGLIGTSAGAAISVTAYCAALRAKRYEELLTSACARVRLSVQTCNTLLRDAARGSP